jgi:hypothetical protein
MRVSVLNSQMAQHNPADVPKPSTRRSRSEREFEPPRRIIYPVPRLLVVRVDVREPADATHDDILQVAAVLIYNVVVVL